MISNDIQQLLYFINWTIIIFNPDKPLNQRVHNYYIIIIYHILYFTGILVPIWYPPPPKTTKPRSIPPFIINIVNFFERKKINNVYYSPPFYTSTDGYKLQIMVFANGVGRGKGTHVSLFVCLMKGENDQNQQWPFEGDISIQMLNWRNDSQHKEAIISFNDSADMKCRSKWLKGKEE